MQKKYSVKEMRYINPRAYEKWTEKEDKILLNLVDEKKTLEQIALRLQRGNGAIKSRIDKLEANNSKKISGISRGILNISGISYEWVPIQQQEGQLYKFPGEISNFMKRIYSSPAIYRWNIFSDRPSDLRFIYIGECKKLISDRLNGYLKPGPKQTTNIRINSVLSEEVGKGNTVILEVLKFADFCVGNKIYRQQDLEKIVVRRLIESQFIVFYAQEGFKLLNKTT